MNLLEILGLTSMIAVAMFTYHAAFVQRHTTGQSPRAAIIEAWTNIAIGFSLNLAANEVMIPLMSDGGHLSLSANFWGGWVYTAISITRQYVIRRWFNGSAARLATRLAGKS